MGHPIQQLERAIFRLQGFGRLEKSRFYESQPWGVLDQPNFINGAVRLSWPEDAITLLKAIKQIESELGRKPEMKWGPRVIDIDILFFGDEIVNSNHLCIPHRHLAERRFVLAPMADLAPDFVHPVLNKTIQELLRDCPDSSWVQPIIS